MTRMITRSLGCYLSVMAHIQSSCNWKCLFKEDAYSRHYDTAMCMLSGYLLHIALPDYHRWVCMATYDNQNSRILFVCNGSYSIKL